MYRMQKKFPIKFSKLNSRYYFLAKFIHFWLILFVDFFLYISDSNFLKFNLHLFKMSQHEAIIQLFCVEKMNPKIVKNLKAPKSTLWDAVN